MEPPRSSWLVAVPSPKNEMEPVEPKNLNDEFLLVYWQYPIKVLL
jgi:hypothetical protein